MRKAAIIFFATIILTGCVSTREAAKREVLRLDAQHFKDTMTVKQVSSGNVTEFSTLNGYRREKYIGIPWLDSFLIGYLDNQPIELLMGQRPNPLRDCTENCWIVRRQEAALMKNMSCLTSTKRC